MAKRRFSAKFIRRVLRYVPETGEFFWRHRRERPKKWNTRYAGKPAGCRFSRGLYISFKPKHFPAAQLAWLYMTGKWAKAYVDHKDTNVFNNRWENLREATPAENTRNQNLRKNRVGLKGAHFHKPSGRWRARIKVNYVEKTLGYFKTAKEAHQAYRQAAIALHKEFANFGGHD